MVIHFEKIHSKDLTVSGHFFQYQEDLNELNEIARHRPRSNLIMGLVQESSQIRELQQENKELRLALEEHQSALELIMSKYREQVYKLVMVNKLDQKAGSQQDEQKVWYLHANYSVTS